MYFRRRSEKVELLRSVPLFANMSKRQLNELAKRADEDHADAGEVLTREGQTGRDLLIIARGKARVSRHGKELATLGPGDFVGEMALLDGRPRSATVVAEEPLVMLVVVARNFRPLLRTSPEMAEALLESLARRLRSVDEALTH